MSLNADTTRGAVESQQPIWKQPRTENCVTKSRIAAAEGIDAATVTWLGSFSFHKGKRFSSIIRNSHFGFKELTETSN